MAVFQLSRLTWIPPRRNWAWPFPRGSSSRQTRWSN